MRVADPLDPLDDCAAAAGELPRYDPAQGYLWNYEHAPAPAPASLPAVDVPELPGRWSLCGLPVDSPLGIPAGPLLNGKWVLYYAALGFDVLTYKTVRSRPRACYPLPNLVPVDVGPLRGDEDRVPASPRMRGSWAVSFGMPSMDPQVWRRDIEATRAQLPEGKLLSVSVVGTMQPEWTIDELADDYARCARWAVESGADLVETNFSCPNVSTCDGQLYQDPAAARTVADRVRSAARDVPYLIKIGHVRDESAARELLSAVSPFADGLAMTNSVAARVVQEGGDVLFDGQPRGICGRATLEASVAQVSLFSRLIDEAGLDLEIIGVGGAATAADVQQYLSAGASAVHLATAAMIDPLVGIKIRGEMSAGHGGRGEPR